jgi:hypothetical protein
MVLPMYQRTTNQEATNDSRMTSVIVTFKGALALNCIN